MDLPNEGLTTGTRIGPYEILRPLGAGGMGCVYLARDTKLDRQVAIKALPPEFATDVDRLSRFQREAKFLAALNHPNIAGIYGLEASGADEYLVLEYVPGESLADRLDRGPLPVDEALEVCRQVALALEAAHENGVIHRDLKPGNVMVTPEGTVKVLDFGLAKADAISSGPGQDPTKSPTISATATGTITGTAGYMSPEQVRGKRVDKRSDVWSFGCVLYECLCGKLAFGGDSAVDRLSAILEREPEWSALPPNTPHRVLELLQRCLVKDPKSRLRDVGDARLEIEKALSEGAWRSGVHERLAFTPRSAMARWAPWGVALALLAAGFPAAWLWHRSALPEPAKPLHVEIRLPAQYPIQTRTGPVRLAISLDGTQIVYEGRRGDTLLLCRRSLEGGGTAPISGTERGINPFFSPDGRWVGFTSLVGGQMYKVPVEGGVPTIISDAKVVWSAQHPCARDGWIYMRPSGTFMGKPKGSLFRVRVDGGQPEAVAVPDESRGEKSFWYRNLLPDGEHLLAIIRNKSDGFTGVLSLKDPSFRKKVLDQSNAVGYVPTGHLLTYTPSEKGPSAWYAVGFDAKRLEVRGEPQAVLTDADNPVFSRTGTLAYLTASQLEAQPTLAWVDRAGNSRPLLRNVGQLWHPRFSPDGRRVAIERIIQFPAHVWLLDVERGAFSPLTPQLPADKAPNGEGQPVWSPDGEAITFSGANDGSNWVVSLRTGAVRALWPAPQDLYRANSWSPDGRFLVLDGFGGSYMEYASDHWIAPADGSSPPKPLLNSGSIERGARISPDGKWIAYFCDESGKFEVYVQAFPELGQKVQVSTNGGLNPLWSKDGKEMFYLEGDKIMAVPIKLTPTFAPGAPRELFDFPVLPSEYESVWDVAPDGQHFVILEEDRANLPLTINLVFNWFEELKRKVPTR